LTSELTSSGSLEGGAATAVAEGAFMRQTCVSPERIRKGDRSEKSRRAN